MGPSRQEWRAWASGASSLAILGFYLIWLFSLPEHIGDSLGSVLFKVIIAATAVDVVLSLTLNTPSGRVEKDERDRLIEGLGFRSGYYVLAISVIVIVSQLVLTGAFDQLAELGADGSRFALPGFPFHYLVVSLLLASLANHGTRLWMYRMGG